MQYSLIFRDEGAEAVRERRENKKERESQTFTTAQYWRSDIVSLSFHFPPRSSSSVFRTWEPGRPTSSSLPPSLPLPLLGGRNLLDNCYLHFYPIEEKISNKVGGKRRLEEKKRKNARPSLPQLCLAIHTFQSSYFHRNLEYPSRTNERFVGSKNSAIPSSFLLFLSPFLNSKYIYIYRERDRGEEGWNLIGSFDTDLTDAGTAAIR